MAIKSDILAKKLARPPRKPQLKPTVSDDGSKHYRVFDEPENTSLPEERPVQDESSVAATVVQKDNDKKPADEQTSDIPVPPVPPPTAKQEHSDIALIAKTSFDHTPLLDAELMISGVASQIMAYLMESIVDEANGITTPIYIDRFAQETSISTGTIRKTIQRLEKKNLISRHRIKNGRGGWTQYKLENYQNLIKLFKK